MKTTLSQPARSHCTIAGLATLPLLCALLTTVGGCTSKGDQATFRTADEGAEALVSAVRADDEKRVRQILGAGNEAVLSSGDPVADRENREDFVAMYDQSHKLAHQPDGSAVVLVGDTEWPMPIPLVRAQRGWRFDVERGKDEMLSRRIGRNELTAMEVSRAIVDAQKEYAAGEGRGSYAAKILSTPGRRDGLYWEAGANEPQSPLGPLAAQAQQEGYSTVRAEGDTGPRPYHGYYYRILNSQGPSAPGGQKSYMDGDRMTGFAIIAYPAQYGNSGIMSFLTDRNGIVYQADLGPDSTQVAGAITGFDPDRRWSVVE